MRLIKSKGIHWLLIVSIMIMAMPMFLLADQSAPNIEKIKQLRQLQNQSVLLKNLKSNSVATQATPEQERNLRLSKALTKAREQALPDLESNHRLNLKRTDRSVPQPQTRALRDVFYGSGRLHMAYPDSIYFNFLTGMNSADTLGMDVMIIGNEGAHIGNESSPNFGTDYSPLLYLAESGSLDDFDAVPAIDDPAANWIETTYDFQYGTQGTFLQAGSVWAVYTRTEGMYVILEITGVYSDWNDGWINFDYKIQTDGTNDFGGGSSSVVAGSSFMNNAVDAERYFNYLQGVHGSDTTGMDVRASGNEGTNFGAEYSFGTDYSPIYLYAADGSLASVTEVGLVDDPAISWVETSWEANGYQPMQVGNVWVIYTRTSNMYAVMEITSMDEWSGYFEFDYMIQTDGSNLFDGGVIEPTSYDMTVNGEYEVTLPIGSNPYFEITLDTYMQGEFSVIWDGNHNGTLDEGDIGLENYEFMDNDMHDEDPAVGVFGFTYSDEMADGLNYLADDLLFVASSEMDMAATLVHFYTEPSLFSVSGTVYMNDAGGAPLAGIVVWGGYENSDGPFIAVVTDGAGQYHLDLPDSGWVNIGTSDHFQMTEGLIPDPPNHMVEVSGHESGYNFYYVAPNSAIEGHVYDEMGNPVEGVEVDANANDGPDLFAITDASGYYSIGVMNGSYDVNINGSNLPGPYVVPYGQWVDVGDFAVATADFTLHTANNSIVGVVTLDDLPYVGAEVVAMNHELGYAMTMSTASGYFEIPVFGGPETFYDLIVWQDEMSNIIQVSDNNHVPAGAESVGIVMETVTGGMFGYFINTDTNLPIRDGNDIGMMMRDVGTGREFYGGPDNNGYYEIHVPPGLYEVMAGGMEWMGPEPDSVLIGEDLIPHDFLLTHMSFDASLDGYVYNNTGAPIPYAQVQIGNDGWGTGMTTDEYGHYHFDLPVGFYYISAWAEGFYTYYDELSVNPGNNNYNFFLESYEVDGAIAGLVYDGDTGAPIPDADVYAYSWDDDESYWAYTDDAGEFLIDLPNGTYDVVAQRWDYPPRWFDGITVDNDTAYVAFGLMLPDGGVDGYVYDDMSNPIQGAEVVIVSAMDSTAGFWGYTDHNGFFSIPAMNGDYHVFASAPGFEYNNYGMISIMDNWAHLQIVLEPREFAVPPLINFIVDQPNDQGRWVRMQFSPGGTEWGSFMGYSIWRMTYTPMGPIVDFVEYLPNHEAAEYNVVLPTLVDSSASVSEPLHYMTGFVVSGHWDTYGFIDGIPGAGYSVDNIHPGAPGPLVLLFSNDTHVELQWEPSMDNDFQYFEVLRASHVDFTDAAVIEMTTAPGTADWDVAIGQTYYYQIVAIDANGNRSEGTNVVSTSIVSVDDLEMMPTAYGLSQNYPNPFNPTTTIEFALPEASQVSLEIYNLLGQKVRTLVNAYMPAGYINTSWDGLDQNGKEISSGTYIYRLQTADQSFSKKMVLMK
ncbi:MAG: carboxypeptidase regulatory-like domain-containing protein [Candidatus Marinimicrobia bacterium]|nr:carboxypeptidase regulatory-like domain-containing protein [Candidatus Neomarinimicrobiota bacterium]MCF7922628.1 carboxypeptidase regulatory-like domain-containing protein [Candidatus Neomarinimicrobiota bacterium]